MKQAKIVAWAVSSLAAAGVVIGVAPASADTPLSNAAPVTASRTVSVHAPTHETTVQPLLTCDYYYSGSQDYPTIAYGSTGAAVKQAQCELNYTIKYGLTIDGKFGSETERATKTFQGFCGLTKDGIIGDHTWAYLNDWYHAGAVCK